MFIIIINYIHFLAFGLPSGPASLPIFLYILFLVALLFASFAVYLFHVHRHGPIFSLFLLAHPRPHHARPRRAPNLTSERREDLAWPPRHAN
jgi:4-amino-4-deoxy-L-arabinose transferase-like glycosyltransferase